MHEFNIKRITPEEYDSFRKLGEEFYEESGRPGKLDWSFHSSMIRDLCNQGNLYISAVVVDYEVAGFLCGLLTRDLFSGEVQAQELFWFVGKEYRKSGVGIALLADFEQWAFDNGAQEINMVNLSEIKPDVSPLYKKRGYGKLETRWSKVA